MSKVFLPRFLPRFFAWTGLPRSAGFLPLIWWRRRDKSKRPGPGLIMAKPLFLLQADKILA
jgi:hypothetical protein